MSTMIKAQHTIVDTNALLKIIQKRYPTIGACDCRLMAIGCNDNFRIKGKRQDYAFRLVRYGWWPEKDVDEELRFLETLQRRKLNICKPVRTDKNQRYFNVKTAEGIRHGMLFTYLPGRPLGHNFGKRNCNMIQLGEILAQIHEAADQMKEPVQRWSMDFDAVFPSFFEAAPSVLGHREKDIAYLRKLAEQFKDVISGQPEGVLDFGLCHGDLHVHNVMLQENGNLGVFDFDWCGYSWRGYDLATVWWSLPRNEKGIAPWRALLRGYTQVRKLSPQEKKLLPWFVVFRQFEYFNFQLSVRKHFGDSWMNDNYYDFHMAFLKNWVKQHPDVMS
jgi:Ser/Thr protein kinase RdoA (MazF antagonist)